MTAKERVLNVQVPKGILPGQTIRLAGQGARARTGKAYRRRSVHRSRIPAASAVSDRRPRLVSRFAGGAVGSGARRHREDADADRHRRFEDTGGLARRQQAQTQGPRHTRITARRFLCGAADRAACRRRRARPGPPTAPWPTRCRSILAPASECNVMPLTRRSAAARRNRRGMRRPQRRGLESNVCGRRAAHRGIGGGRRPQRGRNRTPPSGASAARRCAARASRCAWSATWESICPAWRSRWTCWKNWNNCAVNGKVERS